jgi:hypothetical protein
MNFGDLCRYSYTGIEALGERLGAAVGHGFQHRNFYNSIVADVETGGFKIYKSKWTGQLEHGTCSIEF